MRKAKIVALGISGRMEGKRAVASKEAEKAHPGSPVRGMRCQKMNERAARFLEQLDSCPERAITIKLEGKSIEILDRYRRTVSKASGKSGRLESYAETASELLAVADECLGKLRRQKAGDEVKEAEGVKKMPSAV